MSCQMATIYSPDPACRSKTEHDGTAQTCPVPSRLPVQSCMCTRAPSIRHANGCSHVGSKLYGDGRESRDRLVCNVCEDLHRYSYYCCSFTTRGNFPKKRYDEGLSVAILIFLFPAILTTRSSQTSMSFRRIISCFRASSFGPEKSNSLSAASNDRTGVPDTLPILYTWM